MEKLRKRFVVLDGIDGCGKSTQQRMLAEKLRANGVDAVCCRDPGGTVIGERVRSVLLDHDLSAMAVNCETLLFMATRAQLVAEVIRPAVDSGKTVLCDRFVSSTCAYQGAAGYDPRRVVELAKFAIDKLWPNLTLILDLDVDEGFRRIGRKPHHVGRNRKKTAGEAALFEGGLPADAMEARPIEFHRRVRQLFLELPGYFPTKVEIIDAQGTPDTVHQRILERLEHVIG